MFESLGPFCRSYTAEALDRRPRRLKCAFLLFESRYRREHAGETIAHQTDLQIGLRQSLVVRVGAIDFGLATLILRDADFRPALLRLCDYRCKIVGTRELLHGRRRNEVCRPNGIVRDRSRAIA